jgi:hypothetical protein
VEKRLRCPERVTGKMASDSLIDKAFTDSFNEANELYDNNRLDECTE